jgi:hypothetical protein
VAGYVLPIGLAVAGVVLWRLLASDAGRGTGEGLPPLPERERERDSQRDDEVEVDPWAAPDRRTD